MSPTSNRGRGRGRGGSGHSTTTRKQLTHFLCLPLINPTSTPQLSASLTQFRADLAAYNASSTVANTVPNSAVRHVGTLHLTLGVMSLLSEEKVEEAIELLKGLDLERMLLEAADSSAGSATAGGSAVAKTFRKANPLVISLQSLLSMHKPTDTSLLYAQPIDASNRLYPFCKALQQQFVDAGLVEEDTRGLKLHATIINTLYAKSELRTVKRVDSTVLVAQFADFEWMKDVALDKVAICKMGAKKTFDANRVVVAEAYEEIAAVDLPQ